MTKATVGSDPSRLSVLFAPAHTLVDETQGGSEYHWPYKLIEALARDHGARITALTIQQCIEHRPPGVEFVSVDPGGSLPMSNLQSLRFHLRCYAAARKILASGRRVDVVHHMLPFNYRATFNLLAVLRRRTDPPMVIGPLQRGHTFDVSDETQVFARDFSFTNHGSPSRSPLPPLSTYAARPILSALQRRTLSRSAALVAVSQDAAELYAPLAGSSALTVIPAGVDTTIFEPPAQTRGEAGSPVEILAVGYLVKRKAIDVLVRATSELVKAGLPVHLRIVGDGPQRPNLESLVHQLDLVPFVSFAGRISHESIVQEYQRSDIFCSTSMHESFGAVGLEAMSCGLPVVATPTGAFQELLGQHDIGTLVNFGAVDELASALANLVRNHPLRQSLGHLAREVVVQKYDWRSIADRYVRVYEQVTSCDGNGRAGT